MQDHSKIKTKHDKDASPKWQRKPESRPDEILDGALKEFCACGYVKARIEDIAAHAGLSKGTVYLYFKSKHEMLKALVRRSVTPIAASLVNIADHMNENKNRSSENILRKMLGGAAAKLLDQKTSSIPLLIIGEAGNFPELADFYRTEVIDVSMKAIEMVINRGIKSGEFRPINVDLTIRSLMSVVIMQIIWNGVFKRKGEDVTDTQELINSHLDLFLNGVLTAKGA